MFSGFGAPEIILILVFVILFFGAKKIPDIAKGLGQGVREFKKVSSDIKEEVNSGEGSQSK